MNQHQNQKIGPIFRVGVNALIGPYAEIEGAMPLTRKRSKRFRQRDFHHFVQIFDARTDIYAELHGKGRVNVSLIVANFGKKPIRVRTVYVDWLNIGTGTVSSPEPRFPGNTNPLPASSIAYVNFEVPISESELLKLRKSIGKSQNPYSSPAARLDISGNLRLTSDKYDEHVRFKCDSITPEIHLPAWEE